MRIFLLGVLSLTLSTCLFATNHTKTTIDDIPGYLLQSDVKRAGTYDIPFCFSTFTVPKDRFMLIRNYDNYNDVVVSKNDFSDEIVVTFTNCGFSWVEDFEQIDVKKHFEEIQRKTNELNNIFVEQGMEKLIVRDYLQQPIVDKKRNIIFYAIEFTKGDKSFVNSVALKLGRKGFVTFIWITDLEHYIPCEGELGIALKAHHFNEGFRYEDYQTGDQLAFHPFLTLANQLYLMCSSL